MAIHVSRKQPFHETKIKGVQLPVGMIIRDLNSSAANVTEQLSQGKKNNEEEDEEDEDDVDETSEEIN